MMAVCPNERVDAAAGIPKGSQVVNKVLGAVLQAAKGGGTDGDAVRRRWKIPA